MANPFYTYSGAFIPGTLARAEQVGTEYSAVQAGFAVLAIQGTDAGSANTYVVTTNGGPSGSYADGNIVEFKAAASNTGASTINVNGIGVVGLTASGGGTLPSGAVVANTWYRAIYNSTYSAFTLIAPSSVTISTSTISAAAPTNKVGLSAAGGTSLAVVPIDATYAIDQSIAPTWTGAHTFGNAVTFNASVSFAAGLSLVASSDQYALVLTGYNGASHSKGLSIVAGFNATDIPLVITNRGGATRFFQVTGDGSLTVGNPTLGGQGAGTLNATGLFVNGAAVITTGVSSANPSATIGLAAVNGSAATFTTSDSAPALSQAIAPTWTAAHTFTPSSAVTALTINAAANSKGLVVTGGTNTVNTFAMTIATGLGSGFSSGLAVTAGTTSADTALLVRDATGGTNFAIIYGDGEFMVAAPTSAAKQASNFYQVGYLDIPLRVNNAPVIQDRGKWIDATNNVVLPANASVAFPIGATLMIYNTTASAITISITTDTLTWIPGNTNGTRTLAANSLATVYKRTATTWLIWGFGLT